MSAADANPLLREWTGPFGLPPFAEVRAEHFKPAFLHAMAVNLEEIEVIASAPASPTFENTVAALDRAGRLLGRIGGLFYNLTASETSVELQAIDREMAPLLAAHDSRVYMHAGLFARVEQLHEGRGRLGLGDEQRRLLERFHIDFVRAGARLDGQAQRRYADVMQELAALTTRFGQNVLADEAGFRLVLRGEAELAGLPGFARAAARQAAADAGIDGDDAAPGLRAAGMPAPMTTAPSPSASSRSASSRRNCTAIRRTPTMRSATPWRAARPR